VGVTEIVAEVFSVRSRDGVDVGMRAREEVELVFGWVRTVGAVWFRDMVVLVDLGVGW
jgi:hypothetical protein